MRRTLAMAFIALAALGCAARAQTLAYTARQVNLRAGPDRDYPVVAVLPPGFQVSVQGCLDTYTWCDVLAGTLRGWVYAGNITSYHQNSYGPLLTWGPVIGVTILGFGIDDYWTQHYWNRPWYPQRHRWYGHPLPPPRPHLRPNPPAWPHDGRPPAPPPPPQVRPAPPGAPQMPDGRPWHPRRPDETAPLRPHPPRPVAPGQRPPGVAPAERPPGMAPGAPVQPRPSVGPGLQRPPGVTQPPPRPERPRGEDRPRALPDNSGRGQPQYP